MDGSLKKHIVTALQPVFLSPLVNQLTGFGQVSALNMLQHIFNSYTAIEEIDLEENTVKMMSPYDPAELLARLIEKLGKGGEFSHAVGNTISYTMMVSKGITPLAQMDTFNNYIRDWVLKTTKLKRWDTFKTFFHQAHGEQSRAVATAGKWGCTAEVQNVYGVPPYPP